MRSDREETMRRHPASGVAVIEEPEESRPRPYKQFIDALEDFEMVVSLHGVASTEAALARANVRRLRDLATDAWRSGDAA